MSDLALTWDSVAGSADLSITANDYTTDDGFETAVLLSLFTDAQAADSDVLPDEETDQRGWWADGVPVVENDTFGSKLWLLARSKDTQEVLTKAQTYAAQALQWLIDDSAAKAVSVTTESQPYAPGRTVLALGIDITRPNGKLFSRRFDYNWVSQEAKRVS